MLSRDEAGELHELDLNPLLGDPRWRPAAHLFGLNGAATNGGDGGLTEEAFAATVGFTLEDLRRLTERSGRASTPPSCSSSTSGRGACARRSARRAGSSSRRACSRPR